MNPESCINKYAVSIGGTYEFALAGTWAPDKNHTSLASFPSLHSLPPLTRGDNCFTLLLWVFLGICHEIAYGFLASCLASCPTWTSKFLIANFVLLWLDMHTCINLVNVSSSLVVVFYKLGPWLGGRLDGPPWSLLKWFPGWDLQPLP